MRVQSILLSLVFATSFALPVRVIAQQSPDSPNHVLDDAARSAVIDGLLKQIDRIYIFPEMAKRMEQAIRARKARKEYASITSGQEFARTLTDHLRQVCKDRHLSVDYFPQGIPYDSEKPPAAEEIQQFRERGRRRNYEFKKVERLDGGIGLLQVDGFYPGDWVGDTAAAAMTFLANSEAIILDLRQNHGGYPTGVVLLCSYFLKEETRLSDQVNRAENTTRQYWSYPVVPGPRLAEKDLYILTSRETFSAAESLAYDLQALKRATIVGETTGGGAHGTTIYRITDHFSASIPFSNAINPITKTDWEGTGVKPDVAVPADQALLTAHLMALEKALRRHGDDTALADSLKRAIAEKEKEMATLKAKPVRP